MSHAAGGNRYEYANGVLRNTFGITDTALLQQAETTFVAIRQSELALQSSTGQFDLDHLKAIHYFLFQDIYDWAGEIRQVDISKGNSPFAHFGYIESNALTLFARLAQEHYLQGLSRDLFVQRAAFYLGEINVLHPFREGNGRTQRIFCNALAQQAGYALNWDRITEQQMIDASILSLVRDDNTGFLTVAKNVSVCENKRTQGYLLLGRKQMANRQVLTYSLRVPDGAQADALRLLDDSRAVVNQTITALWSRLPEFLDRPAPQAWKHVTELMDSPDPHGNRQWRCEAESAGRILRAQAERQRLFRIIHHLLSDGLMIAATPTTAARKDRTALMTAIRHLAQTGEAAVMELVNVAEQCCNVYLRTGRFPTIYDELQPIPILKTGLLTYAGDDGMKAGQAYRISIDLDTATLSYRMRGPDAAGVWRWPDEDIVLSLPTPLVELLRTGAPMAPTLREVADPGQERYAVLDVIVEVPTKPAAAWEEQDRVLGFDWGVRSLLTTAVVTISGEQQGRPFFLNTGGFDGQQARLRRQIDRLKKKRASVVARSEQRPDHVHRPFWEAKLTTYEQEIVLCWRKYERRNRELAHLATNILVFLAQIHGCSLICGEQLSSLRATSRGKNVRGRWRNWRTNTTIRSELQRVLAYKAHRWGIRVRQEQPKNTSHTCPRCHQHADTYRSSHIAEEIEAVNWGKWLICPNPRCAWNGARDYAAALNLARLGIAFLQHYQATKAYRSFTMASSEVKPCRYIPQGEPLRLPAQGFTSRPAMGKKLAYSGWTQSVHLRTAQPFSLLIVLSSATIRKQVLVQESA